MLNALADDKINVTKKMKLVLERVENFVGKGDKMKMEERSPKV